MRLRDEAGVFSSLFPLSRWWEIKDHSYQTSGRLCEFLPCCGHTLKTIVPTQAFTLISHFLSPVAWDRVPTRLEIRVLPLANNSSSTLVYTRHQDYWQKRLLACLAKYASLTDHRSPGKYTRKGKDNRRPGVPGCF